MKGRIVRNAITRPVPGPAEMPIFSRKVHTRCCAIYVVVTGNGPAPATSNVNMTSLSPAPAAASPMSLQSEAAHVERLRRQIAEMPAKGQTASPELLAEFARAQKAYLDRKIEFEKQRRRGVSEAPSAPSAADESRPILSETSEAAPGTPKEAEQSPNRPKDAPRKSPAMIMVISAIAGIAAGVLAWVLSRS